MKSFLLSGVEKTENSTWQTSSAWEVHELMECFVVPVLAALYSCAVLALEIVHRDGEGKEGSVFYLVLRNTLHCYSYKYFICQWTYADLVCLLLRGANQFATSPMCLMHAPFAHLLCVSSCAKVSKDIFHEALSLLQEMLPAELSLRASPWLKEGAVRMTSVKVVHKTTGVWTY